MIYRSALQISTGQIIHYKYTYHRRFLLIHVQFYPEMMTQNMQTVQLRSLYKELPSENTLYSYSGVTTGPADIASGGAAPYSTRRNS